MDPILKHNLEHNGLWNANQWIGFRFYTYDFGVMEIVERDKRAAMSWYYRAANDPESRAFPVTTYELLEKYTVQLEKFVLKLQKEIL